MSMEYARVAREVLAAVGGRENVRGNMACMTRLRLTVADPAKVNGAAVRAVEGVMALVEDVDRCEVVFGPGVVNKVLDEFVKLTGVKAGDVEDVDVRSAAAENKAAQRARYDKPVQYRMVVPVHQDHGLGALPLPAPARGFQRL